MINLGKLRTWMVELAFVSMILLIVAVLSRKPLELLGALAVALSFAHAQVADRLAEREAARARPEVDCHRWVGKYFLAKEICWCGYFTLHGSWSALAGVALFLMYPAWRQLYRKNVPMRRIA